MIGIFGFTPNNKKFLDRRKSILRIIPSSAVGWTGVQSWAAELQSESSEAEQEIVFDVAIKPY